MDPYSFSTCSGRNVRMIQIMTPIMKKALGGNKRRPFDWYQPPSVVKGKMEKPKSFPEPKSSRTIPTAKSMAA